MQVKRALHRKALFLVILLCMVFASEFVLLPTEHSTARAYITNERTLSDVVSTLSERVRPTMRGLYESRGLPYPPAELTLIAVKNERRLEVWSPDDSGKFVHVRNYPILAASGSVGPKLRRGDRQVPEGIYSVTAYNPNSAFHLSMKIDYPNDFDRMMADYDHRTNLGGDIFIHGSNVSLGCLAMGDRAIEQLFMLVYDTGRRNTKVIIVPYDFRKHGNLELKPRWLPQWLDELYLRLDASMQDYTY